MSNGKKVLITLLIIAVPVLLFLNTWQGFKYERINAEIRNYEHEQTEWFEENKNSYSINFMFCNDHLAHVQHLSVERHGSEQARSERYWQPVRPQRLERKHVAPCRHWRRRGGLSRPGEYQLHDDPQNGR